MYSTGVTNDAYTRRSQTQIILPLIVKRKKHWISGTFCTIILANILFQTQNVWNDYMKAHISIIMSCNLAQRHEISICISKTRSKMQDCINSTEGVENKILSRGTISSKN